MNSEMELSLNRLLRKIKKDEKAYRGINASIRQIWVALAYLNKEIEDLKREMKEKKRLSENLRKSLEDY